MPSCGVIVGRFQVHELHDGHMELLRTVCGLHNRVILFLGTPPTLATRRNPLDFETRRRMIQAKFPTITVAALPDMPDDAQWSRLLDARIRELVPYGEVTLYGGRDSFVPVYTGDFKPVELPLKIKNTSGEEVRADVSNRVMESPDFRAGVIYATQNQFPRAIMCVDCAIVREDLETVLLAKKKTDRGWRFVGGHLDPRDENLEKAVRREVLEETGLRLDATHYIGSHRVDDWRWTKETDKLFTSLFLGLNYYGVGVAQDDIAEVKWHKLADLREEDFEHGHKPLFKLFRDFVVKTKLENDNETQSAAAN